MAKTRSPQYPAIGLKEAIEKARDIYEKDYQNAIPRALVAEHMGYQGLNGKSLGVLSALIKFGLLEGRGDDTRVTDLAVQIIAHPPGTAEHAIAVAEAAQKPELFKELDGRFPGKASDQAVRSYLLTQKFIPAAADTAIRSYRETKLLVSENGGTDDSGGVSVIEATGTAAGVARVQAIPVSAGHLSIMTPPPTVKVDPYRLGFSPSGGLEGSFQLNSVDDLDELVAALTGMKFVLKKARDIKPPPED